MANVTITSTTNLIIFDSGAYQAQVINQKRARPKSSIHQVSLSPDYVEFQVEEYRIFRLHYTTNSYGAAIVDSINGVAPTDLEDLFNKFTTLLG